MLQRAVQKHDSLPQIKAQQWPKPQKGDNDILKASSASSLNAWNGSQKSSHNPLKRSASQLSSAIPAQPTEGSNRRSILHNIPKAGARMEKLHGSLDFNENDFEDDDAIDLDEDFPTASYAEATHPAPAISYPTLPADITVQYPKLPTLSAESLAYASFETANDEKPIAWSSYPPLHSHNKIASSKARDVPEADIDVIPEPKAVKRRRLPWSTDSDAPAQVKHASQGLRERIAGARYAEDNSNGREIPRDARGFDAKIPEYVREQMALSKSNKDEAKQETPRTAKASDHPVLWNTTASAVKAEQKRFRQDQRKQVKSVDQPTKGRKPAKEEVSPVFLSDEQRSVLNLVTNHGKSVFFTGPAGTGKSVLLREIISALRERYRREPDRVAVTASTGLAACNVGGVTLHSFAGIGLGKEPTPELVKKIKRNPKSKQRWLRTKVLIVDEISMVDGDLFDKLEEVARVIRNNGRPFGGIKLVITGDFFQLPPVPERGAVARFSFDAATWNTSIEHTIGLTSVFRQRDPGQSASTSLMQ